MMTVPPLRTFTFVPVTGQIICRSVAVNEEATETKETPNKGKKRPAESSPASKAATPITKAFQKKKDQTEDNVDDEQEEAARV